MQAAFLISNSDFLSFQSTQKMMVFRKLEVIDNSAIHSTTQVAFGELKFEPVFWKRTDNNAKTKENDGTKVC